jgi:hypothetical protein
MIACIFISTGLSAGILKGNLGKKYKEKREQLYNSLPVPIKRIAIARVISPILVWFVLAILFVAIVVIMRSYRVDIKMVSQLLSLNGLILLLNSSSFIYSDLIFYFNGKNKRLIVWAFYFLFITIVTFLLVWLFLHYVKIFRFLQHFRDFIFFSFWGVSILNLFGLILTYTSIVIYTKRKSYLE